MSEIIRTMVILPLLNGLAKTLQRWTFATLGQRWALDRPQDTIKTLLLY